MLENHLDLCIKHKQEWKQSHFAEHNCDYCKAERRFNALIADLEEALSDEYNATSVIVRSTVQTIINKHKRADE